MKNIIEIINLKKSFGDIKAVDNISFSVKEGELFAFLGVNGAGKSTTINIICGVYGKDSGKILVNDLDIDKNLDKIKNMLGVVYQESALDKQLTVKDNLEYKASLYNLSKQEYQERLDMLDDLLKIKELLDRYVGKLSGGQRRRVDIARAILNKPKILILDEPTTGLDPKTRKMVWNAIEKLRTQNKITVFLTTHYMEETIDADNVVILDSGKIVAQGTPLQLKNQYTADYIRFYDATEEEMKKLNVPYKKIAKHFIIEVNSPLDATKLITKHPEIFRDYEITKGQMDDVFLAVTGKNIEFGGSDE